MNAVTPGLAPAAPAQPALDFITGATLRACMPKLPAPETWVAPFRTAMRRWGITSRLRAAAFLAQVGHESLDCTRLTESLDYDPPGLARAWPTRFAEDPKARPLMPNEQAKRLGRVQRKLAMQPAIAEAVYGGRMGNDYPGDGWKYRGAGAIQLTGFTMHNAFGIAHDILTSEVPDWLRTPEGAIESAAWYWNTRALNGLADAQLIDEISRKINGAPTVAATIGLLDRRARYIRCRAVMAS